MLREFEKAKRQATLLVVRRQIERERARRTCDICGRRFGGHPRSKAIERMIAHRMSVHGSDVQQQEAERRAWMSVPYFRASVRGKT